MVITYQGEIKGDECRGRFLEKEMGHVRQCIPSKRSQGGESNSK